MHVTGATDLPSQGSTPGHSTRHEREPIAPSYEAVPQKLAPAIHGAKGIWLARSLVLDRGRANTTPAPRVGVTPPADTCEHADKTIKGSAAGPRRAAIVA